MGFMYKAKLKQNQYQFKLLRGASLQEYLDDKRIGKRKDLEQTEVVCGLLQRHEAMTLPLRMTKDS